MQQPIKSNHQSFNRSLFTSKIALAIYSLLLIAVAYSCNSSSATSVAQEPPLQQLPVITLANSPATTYQEFSASLEGSKDIEIRPQVDGIIDRILVDEGAYVKQGQLLFVINSRPYSEQLNNAKASLAAANANLVASQINVAKLEPLVQSNVISDIQLKTAKAANAAAAAAVAQSQAVVQNANINVGYTQIKAPVDGYIGRIHYKTGSLVGTSTAEALTVISAVKDIYAYFSFSEKDFMEFKTQFAGNTIEEKIKNMPPVELVLADNSVYPLTGKVEIVSGQFNNSMGSISFRADFKNPDGMLRSGNTGKIRVPHSLNQALVVPQEATFELQDKVFVFVVGDSNKVVSKPIDIMAKNSNYYFVQNALKPGDKIVYSGLDRLRDGAKINPEAMSMDSVYKTHPL